MEEALCFGWIDSIIKKLDSLHAVQRFMPRNPKSGYSQQNKERLRWLSDNGLLHRSLLARTLTRSLSTMSPTPACG